MSWRRASWLSSSALGVRLDSILAIPSGVAAVGCAVALERGAPLSVAVMRKLLYPWAAKAGFELYRV
ncbi:MAG: hypothetical protein QXZ31_09875 [Thermofilaceae archaeon]